MRDDNEIVLIGNGPSVFEKKIGHIIDSFVNVVRFNDYVIDGFEEHIGTKTTIWARGTSSRTIERRRYAPGIVLVCSPGWSFKRNKKVMSKYKKFEKKVWQVPKKEAIELTRSLKLVGNKKGHKKRGWASTGLLAINYFCLRGYKVYIYGFDCFEAVAEHGRPMHYYDDKELPCNKSHSSKKEKRWITGKLNAGKINNIFKIVL